MVRTQRARNAGAKLLLFAETAKLFSLFFSFKDKMSECHAEAPQQILEAPQQKKEAPQENLEAPNFTSKVEALPGFAFCKVEARTALGFTYCKVEARTFTSPGFLNNVKF